MAADTTPILFVNATLLDGEGDEARPGHNLLVEGGRIVEVSDAAIRRRGARRIDLRGKTLMPGLVDCHVHVVATIADLGANALLPDATVAFGSAAIMRGMLMRGFTTVRDLGGADHGVAQAQAEGLVRGPRLHFCGQPLSQTGGHGDDRAPADDHCWTTGVSRIADGVDAVRAAARDELRKGAHHVKVMASGGVASPTDRIDSTQYSMDELVAVVEEAEAANRYVAAHAYTVRAVERALRAGVRSIEHANLIDETVVDLFRERDAYVVMNLVTYRALQDEGREVGLPEESWRKVADVLDGGYRALELAHREGLRLCYGSDLLGPMQQHQSREFTIRGEIQPAIDVLRSATTTAADLLGESGRVGTLRPGGLGDLVVLDADPLDDLAVLTRPVSMPYVVQGGRVVVDRSA